MYINRTDPLSRTDTASRKSIVSRKGKDGSFAETMSSVIEVDVVEVGDDANRKQQEQLPKQDLKKRSEAEAEDEAPASLDVKA